MNDFVTGMYLGLGLVLLVAVALKVRRLQGLEMTLVAVAPASIWSDTHLDSRSVARGVLAVEGLVAIALLAGWPTHPTAAGAAIALFSALLAITCRAAARRVPCACFGPHAKPAGTASVVRTGGLLVISVATLLLTTATTISVPTFGWGTLAATAAIMFWAMLPVASARALSTVRESAAAGGGTSRRTFLQAAVAAVTLLMVAPAAFAGPPRSCRAQFELCYGCDRNQADCCIECYVNCQIGGGCVPGLSCGRCWPGP